MLGLGSEYGTTTGSAGHYASPLYWGRQSQTSNNPYLWSRDMESGSWGSWRKFSAGNSDSLGGVAASNFLRSDTSDEMFGTLILHSGGNNTYGWLKGYNNNNHFIMIRGNVTGSTSNPSRSAGHFHTYCEYLNTDSSAFQFKRSDTGTYSTVCSITRVGLTHVGNITAYSDIRLKENIEVIPNALEKVSTLRGVTYNRIDLTNKNRQTGVIAQEIEEVLPEAVTTDDEGIKSVAYGNLVGLLIEAIKELKKENEELNQRIKTLESA